MASALSISDSTGLETRSNASKSSTTSTRKSSCSSVSPETSAAVEAAILKTKLKYFEQEKLEESKLERIKILRDLEIAETKLRVLGNGRFPRSHSHSEVESEDPVQVYVNSLPEHPPIDQFSPPTYSMQQPPVNNNNNNMIDLVKAFAEQVNLTKLPVPEPNIFYGDPMKYPSWKTSFCALIENKDIPVAEQMYYLKKYLGGAARECVESYFLLDSSDAFQQAKELLDNRFGNKFVIASAFREKLDNWPTVKPRDGLALQKYADFLRQCLAGSNTYDSLRLLNDPLENQKMFVKLPDSIRGRWSKIVNDYKESVNDFPPFMRFVKFVAKEAEIACDPITGINVKPKVDSYSSKPFRSNNFVINKPDSRYADTRKSNVFSSRVEFPPVSNNNQHNSHYGTIQIKCHSCQGNHHLRYCEQFARKSDLERQEFCRNNRLCYICYWRGHMAKYCKNRNREESRADNPEYSKNRNRTEPRADNPESANQETFVKRTISHNSKTVDFDTVNKCSMIVPVWVSTDQNSNERLVYCMQDSQSDSCFILPRTLDALGVKGQNVKISLSTMLADSQIIDSDRFSGLFVRGYDSDIRIPLPPVYTRDIMPADKSHIPTPDIARKWPHLECIADKLLPLQDCDVELLIGYNCARALAPREVISHDSYGPYGQKTDLGWGVVGIVNNIDHDNDNIGPSHRSLSSDNIVFSYRTQVKEVSPADILNLFEIDFSERNLSKQGFSKDDRDFLDQMNNSIHLTESHHFEMCLPFKGSRPMLPNNRNYAFKRFNNLLHRFEKDNNLKQDYCDFMDKILEREYAEKVPIEELDLNDGTVFYIPHHSIFNEKKNKIRVVFDCNTKYCGVSLNDTLLKGPDLTNKLLGVLLRFRLESVAILCDIEQMFYQFYVNHNDRNYLRFIWQSKLDSQPTDYRMCVHLFGAGSSPGCANFSLKYAAESFESQFSKEAGDFVRKHFYVDDGLASVKTDKEAIDLIKQTKEMLAMCGLRLHKFVSNSKAVLDTIPAEDCAGITKLDIFAEQLTIERALGVQWNIISDSFQFRICLSDQPLTRRGILSTVSQIYDPLGLICPVVLVGKRILQELCRIGLDWDHDIPDELRARWEQWRINLLDLQNLEIQRCYKPVGFGKGVVSELHHFSDASTYGYGQCSYLRQIDDKQNVFCSLVMGKSRVTPIKPITVPRLELTAAVVSVKVAAQIKLELEMDNLRNIYWTDSTVVLGYLNNDVRRYQMFVANRVQQILDCSMSNQWHHISSGNNVADLASRGCCAKELCESNWFNGPKFLWNNKIEFNTNSSDNFHLSPEDPNIRKGIVLATNTKLCFEISRLNHMSDWHRAKRVIARCVRIQNLYRVNNVHVDHKLKSDTISVNELHNAETVILTLVQAESFPDEIKVLSSKNNCNKSVSKNSPLYRLDPFINKDGLICVGGRLKRTSLDICKYPVILPKKHFITDLIIKYYHEHCFHQGRGISVQNIRSHGYWIIGCTKLMSSYINNCVMCRKLRGQMQVQYMADLPKDRMENTPMFTFCAVDCFGPWLIREGRKELKRYGIIFVCIVSRAVHVETLIDMTTDSFLNALRRFLCIRGPIRQLCCDNGSNFIGGNRELHELFVGLDHIQIQRLLLEKGCDYFEFKFNVPHASHMGGIWERQIRSLRNVISPLLMQLGTQLDDESLRTVMYEAALVVNSRPLSVNDLNDSNSLEPLSCNNLLTMKSHIVLPPAGEFQKADVYSRKRWRRVQHIANEFWNRWRKECIHNLQIRSKWNNKSVRNICVDDIVMIVDDNMSRNQWQLGRVVEVYPDKDNRVRKVKLLIGDKYLNNNGKRVNQTSYLERPVQKLVLLIEAE
ncbi:hypothetical protein SNE40_020252 [Patella caerulea]|uniref:Integrase catalytic domain-containing protein n=1 Tax=Patella caerulea TaxID=87958 RepID=A0AAN8J162_PATCE